jgi:hypothetical protein
MRITPRKAMASMLLSVSIFLGSAVTLWSAEVIFQDEFQNLDNWDASDGVTASDGVLKVRALMAEGLEWSGADTLEQFDDFACYFHIKLVDLTGEGDSSFTFRKGETGYYLMFGSYDGGVIDLEDSETWDRLDDAGVDIPLASGDEFDVKVVAEGANIAIQIRDAAGDLIADWAIEHSKYTEGALHFDSWIFGELDISNFVVGTPDYVPEVVTAVEHTGKAGVTWGRIKSQY